MNDKAQIIDLPSPKSGAIFSYLVLSDLHDFAMCEKSFELIIKYFSEIPIEQRRIVLLGDILDFPFLMSKSPEFKQAKKLKDFDDYFVTELQKTYAWFFNFFGIIRNLVTAPDRILYLLGNHEGRAYRNEIRDFFPHAYMPWLNLYRQLKVEELGYIMRPYNTWARISADTMPDLMLTHGTYCGANPIKKHFDVAHSSVMFGHTHEYGVTSFKNVEQTVIGYNNPCLCMIDPGPKYLEGKPHNWSKGASIINQTKEAYFVNTLLIQDEKLITPDGRLFK